MTKPKTMLEMARHDAQELHKKISGNIAKAQAAGWPDVKTVQADANALAIKMKTAADGQAEAAKTAINAAIAKLEAASKLVESKATAAKDDVRQANVKLLDGAHTAAESLSKAIAVLRTKAAENVEPKKVFA